jgi:hypothetical protein
MAALVACLYVAGYGALRVQKVLLRSESWMHPEIKIILKLPEVTDWIGLAKQNLVNTASLVYSPASRLEERLWRDSCLCRKYLRLLPEDKPDENTPLICLDTPDPEEIIRNLPDDTNDSCE